MFERLFIRPESLQLYLKEPPTCEFCEFFVNTFFTEHLPWQLLIVHPLGVHGTSNLNFSLMNMSKKPNRLGTCNNTYFHQEWVRFTILHNSNIDQFGNREWFQFLVFRPSAFIWFIVFNQLSLYIDKLL